MSETMQASTSAETVEITYIDNEGVAAAVVANVGDSLMEVATFNSVLGIDADCGGCCACGTCRVYLDESLLAQLEPADEDELAVLEFVAEPDTKARLGCQIRITEQFQGALVKVAT